MNPLVTIVIPVYQVENYLNRCISSVVSQTYRNLEIILVDDGSPDRCPQMCDEWAEKDSRIRVIHKQNSGQGMARNTGIEHAHGSYICFFDSDDYVDLNVIECACKLAEQEHADTVIFGMAGVDEHGIVCKNNPIVLPQKVFQGSEIQKLLLPEMLGTNLDTGIHSGLSMSACRELFSMELIKRTGFRFVSEREIISEDYYSVLTLYRYVRKTVVLDDVNYYYCYNSASFSHIYRPDRFEKLKYFYSECLKQCEKLGFPEEVSRRCQVPFLNGVFAVLKQEVTVGWGFRETMKVISEKIRDPLLQEVLKKHKKDKVNLKKKLFFWAMRNKVYILCYLFLVIRLQKN